MVSSDTSGPVNGFVKERTRIALNEVGLMDSRNPLYNEFC
jgi:hypothetical protein